MTSVLTYAAVVSLILAVVLAVARDVPILHLFGTPDVEVNEFLVAGLGFLVEIGCSMIVNSWHPSGTCVVTQHPWYDTSFSILARLTVGCYLKSTISQGSL